MQRLIAFFIFIFAIATTHAQSPKREFRAAWVASVANIDWPSKPGLSASEQQQQFIQRLDQLKALGCNAAIVQVRPAADALYDSKLEPWSHYLTGAQGEPPAPYYDPLTFMVAETHKRNMEFHAWFNPYRALMDNKKNAPSKKHITHTHPDWIVNYGDKAIINPGIPEARDYVVDVIADVVKRYDIDAVHLDDYFYPYRIPKKEFNDAKAFAAYGKGMTKDDWRRENVNKFITALNTRIKGIKPWMKLGISPFGIWRNADKDPRGSNTKGGQTNYDDLYADVLLWMQNGWIDYCVPQLYWEHASRPAPFTVLMPWWYGHCYERHVYYGLAPYRMVNAHSGIWSGVKELMWQLRDIRGNCPNSGYAFFSAASFDKITAPIKDSLQYGFNKCPALIPPMPWLDSVAPAAPDLGVTITASGARLEWKVGKGKKSPLRYVVYRFVNGEPVNLDRNDKILSIQQGREYNDPDIKRYKTCKYVVTALDRLWNESVASNEVAGSVK